MKEELLRVHQEILDTIKETQSGFWGIQYPGINPQQLIDWFNTIKAFLMYLEEDKK